MAKMEADRDKENASLESTITSLESKVTSLETQNISIKAKTDVIDEIRLRFSGTFVRDRLKDQNMSGPPLSLAKAPRLQKEIAQLTMYSGQKGMVVIGHSSSFTALNQSLLSSRASDTFRFNIHGCHN